MIVHYIFFAGEYNLTFRGGGGNQLREENSKFMRKGREGIKGKRKGEERKR